MLVKIKPDSSDFSLVFPPQHATLHPDFRA